MATKKSVLKKKTIITIHIGNGAIEDVDGIPAGVGIVITDISGGNLNYEKFLDKTDNLNLK